MCVCVCVCVCVCDCVHVSIYICVCLYRQEASLIKYTFYAIHMIYYWCVAGNKVIVQSLCKGDKSISSLTNDACFKVQDMVLSCLCLSVFSCLIYSVVAY